MIVCPGGGYGKLAIDKEGHEIARWLNALGIAGLVLTYRLARGEGYVHGHRAPVQDAQRAIRLARMNAGEWRVDPGRIGTMGFSAGGHLASTAGTHFAAPVDSPAGDIDAASSRPDFMVLVYPVISLGEAFGHAGCRRNLLGPEPASDLIAQFSNERRVTSETPSAFLVHTNDDGVSVENSLISSVSSGDIIFNY